MSILFEVLQIHFLKYDFFCMPLLTKFCFHVTNRGQYYRNFLNPWKCICQNLQKYCHQLNLRLLLIACRQCVWQNNPIYEPILKSYQKDSLINYKFQDLLISYHNPKSCNIIAEGFIMRSIFRRRHILLYQQR